MAPRSKTRREPKRAVIDLQQKKVYIDLMDGCFKKDKSISLRKLASDLDIKAQTLYGIWRNRGRIRQRLAKDPNSSTTTVTNRLHPIIEVMERKLVTWYNFQSQKGATLVMADLCRMALQIATDLCELQCDQSDKFTFKASTGWFKNFRERHQLQHIPVSEIQASRLETKKNRDNSSGDEE